MTPNKKNRPTRKMPTPDDVIAGASATSLEIARMIHTINPTNRDLDPSSTQSLYSKKSKLQSILIRRFPDSIIIDPPAPHAPDVVSIRLKFFTEDACHARIDTLDRDAAAIVRRLLRESQESLSPLPIQTFPQTDANKQPDRLPEQTTPTPETLLDLGRKALESYDYTEAERLFSDAWSMSGGIDALRELIDFHVEKIGRFDEAVRIAELAGQAAMRDPFIARLVTLAASRIGRFDVVIPALASPATRSAEACLAVFRHLRTTGDTRGALAMFDLALSCNDAAGIVTDAIRAEAVELQTNRLDALEQELRNAWEANRLDHAESLARALAAEKPQHTLANTVLHTIDASRRHLQFNRLTDLAREALRNDDPETAHQRLQEASEYGTLSAQHLQWLGEARRGIDARADAGAVRVIRTFLTAGDARAAFESFAKLKPEMRSRILGDLDDIRFTWIDMAAGNAPLRTLVSAVETLRRARDDLEHHADPADIVRALEPLQVILARVPEVHTALYEAQQRMIALETRAAQERLHALEDALRDNDLDTADTIRRAIDPDRLEPERRNHLNRLVIDLDGRLERRVQERKFDRLMQRGNLFEAMTVARALRISGDADGKWNREIDTIQRAIDEQWKVMIVKDAPPIAYSRILNSINRPSRFNSLLTQDGLRLVIIDEIHDKILIRIFEVESGNVMVTILFTPPRPPLTLKGFVRGEDLQIASTNRYSLVVSLESLLVTEYIDFNDIIDDDIGLEDVIPIPHRDLIWLVESSIRKNPSCYIASLSTRRILRTIPIGLFPEPVLTPDHVLFSDQQKDEGVRLYEEDGRYLTRIRLEPDINCDAMAMHPDQEHMILVTALSDDVDWSDDPHPDYPDGDLRIELHSGTKLIGTAINLRNSNNWNEYSVKTSQALRIVFVLYGLKNSTDASRFMLTALMPSLDGLESLYSIEVPFHSCLVTDIASNHVILVSVSGNDVFIRSLGATAPVVPPELQHGQDRDPIYPESLEHIDRCRRESGTQKVQEWTKRFRNEKETPIPSPDDANEMLDFVEAMRTKRWYDRARSLEEEILHAHPDHPRCRARMAERHLSAAQFREALERLRDIRESTAGMLQAHVHHLLGVAYIGLGNYKEAIHCWCDGEALEHPDECGFEELIDYGRFCMRPQEEQVIHPKWKQAAVIFEIHRRVRELLMLSRTEDAIEYFAARIGQVRPFAHMLALATDIFTHFQLIPLSHNAVMRRILQAMLREKTVNRHLHRTTPFLPPDIGNWTYDTLTALAEKGD